MAEKLLRTKVQLRYDSYENWLAADPVLKAGEMAVVAIPAQEQNTADGVVASATPAIMLKCGDGVSKFSALKWMSGLDAQSYEWSKQPTKPAYSASEIEGLEGFIAGEIQDTDTQYKLVKSEEKELTFMLYSRAKGDAEYTNLEATIDFSTVDTRLKTVEAAIGDNGSVAQAINAAIANLTTDGKTAGTGEIVSAVSQSNGMVSVSTRALVADDIPELAQSKITGLADALASKQDNLVFEDEYNASSNKVATKTTVTNAIEALDKEDSAVAGQFVTAVSETNGIVSVSRAALAASDIPTLEISKVNGLQDALDSKQETLAIADDYNASTNKVATVATITNMIADLNGAMHFEGAVTGDTFEAAIAASGKTYEAGDVVLYGYDEYVYDGTTWHVLGNESIYYAKADAETAHEAINNAIEGLENSKQDNLEFDGTYNADSNKVATVSTVSTAINNGISALDFADAAKSGQFVTAVSETDGIISVSRAVLQASDIPTIGQSQVEGLVDALAAKQNALTFDYTPSETNVVITKTGLENAINALDYEDAAVANQFVTAVVEENGVIRVTRAQPTYEDVDGLATIAHTGNVNDLVQSADDVLVFQCGGANA